MHGTEHVFQLAGKQCMQICDAASRETVYVRNEVDLVLHARSVAPLEPEDTTYYNRLLLDDGLTANGCLGGGAPRRDYLAGIRVLSSSTTMMRSRFVR